MSDLTTAVCSITPTQRRRWFWAAWWTGTPSETPFRPPDASHGGARSFDDALAEAERIANRHLVVVERYWAYAWTRVLRNEKPPRRPATGTTRVSPRDAAPGASLAEIKRAYRARALETHPDHGGNADEFRAVRRAYERLVKNR